jgi:peptidylprolyl isomerase/FKBP-type peptidyl-prolyl cis-trans isomerase FklB
MLRSALIVAAILATAACAKNGPDAKAEAAAFLAKNAHAPGVVTTASGLEYKVLKSGPPHGRHPALDDEVKVNYEGKFLDGKVFDSSYERGVSTVLTVRDLVPGWREALRLMRPGDTWQIYLPPKLGYGGRGAGPIPPDAVLVFKLELIDVLPAERIHHR